MIEIFVKNGKVQFVFTSAPENVKIIEFDENNEESIKNYSKKLHRSQGNYMRHMAFLEKDGGR